MTIILRRLPFFDEETPVVVAEEVVPVRPYQPIIWVSVALADEVKLPPEAGRFPVVLDTGNNHNFSIREGHLSRWAGLEWLTLPRGGQIFLGSCAVPLVALSVWIHRNIPGERDFFAGGRPFRLELEEGAAVYPRGVPNPARLPTLGLRALVENGLDLRIDGKNRFVSLRS